MNTYGNTIISSYTFQSSLNLCSSVPGPESQPQSQKPLSKFDVPVSPPSLHQSTTVASVFWSFPKSPLILSLTHWAQCLFPVSSSVSPQSLLQPLFQCHLQSQSLFPAIPSPSFSFSPVCPLVFLASLFLSLFSHFVSFSLIQFIIHLLPICPESLLQCLPVFSSVPPPSPPSLSSSLSPRFFIISQKILFGLSFNHLFSTPPVSHSVYFTRPICTSLSNLSAPFSRLSNLFLCPSQVFPHEVLVSDLPILERRFLKYKFMLFLSIKHWNTVTAPVS